ncbi:hypothetical protein NMG60_11035492 [Bertholletia excelsa]
MKFLSELWSCWGTVTVTPAAQEVAAQLKRAGNGEPSSWSNGRSRRVTSSANWKPALSVISEEGVVFDDGTNKKTERAMDSQKKSSERGRSTDIIRSPSSSYDYRKDSILTALPVLSPTAFLF